MVTGLKGRKTVSHSKGKISILADCGKLCIYNVIPRESIKSQITELTENVFSDHNVIKIGSR